MKDQATKRPWEVKIAYERSNPNTLIFGMSTKYHICETSGDDNTEAEANARLIVKAVNKYDDNIKTIERLSENGAKALERIVQLNDINSELVEALKECLRALNTIPIERQQINTANSIKLAKKALSKSQESKGVI